MSDNQVDLVVEILRLAYRRGIALRNEQEQSNGQRVNVFEVDDKTKKQSKEQSQPAK
jgi:hypothetical protein